MADLKISELTNLTAADPANDMIPIVDVSATPPASGSTKRISINNILACSPTATLASATINSTLTVNGQTALNTDLTVTTLGLSTLKVTAAKVGIGTSSPTETLHVAKTTATGAFARFQDSANTNYLGTDNGNFRITNAGASDLINIQQLGVFTFGDGAGGTRMTLDSNGLGVGESPVSGQKLTVNGNGSIRNGNKFYLWDTGNSTAHGIYNSGDNLTFIKNNGTASMTLDASGNLLVKKTAVGATTLGAQIQSNGSIASAMAESTDAALNLLVYSTGAAASRFYVGMGGTVFATNTTISAISDARLKENVQDIDVGLGAILALKPRKFDWKEGKGKNIKGDRGFIAQEFEQVFPNLIDEWKDAAPEGEAPYKSVRQDLIPVLVKAIQELAAEVNALKNA